MGHDNRTTEAVPTLSMRQAGSRSYVQKGRALRSVLLKVFKTANRNYFLASNFSANMTLE